MRCGEMLTLGPRGAWLAIYGEHLAGAGCCRSWPPEYVARAASRTRPAGAGEEARGDPSRGARCAERRAGRRGAGSGQRADCWVCDQQVPGPGAPCLSQPNVLCSGAGDGRASQGTRVWGTRTMRLHASGLQSSLLRNTPTAASTPNHNLPSRPAASPRLLPHVSSAAAMQHAPR